MPSPTTALEIIEDALGLTNAVGVDQTLTADETSDCLRAFNDLLEIFSTRRLAVFGQADQTFNTVAGQAVYTIGAGGNWNTVRPVRINEPAYTTINSTTFPCVSINQQQYDTIVDKTMQQNFASCYLYVNEFPLGLVTLYPVPSAVVPMTFSIDRILTAVAAAGTVISFPPGYAHVFTYKLAPMLASKFGKKMANYPEVIQIGNESFADICRANRVARVMQYDPALQGTGGVLTYQQFVAGYY